jgi:aminopeptidase N
MGSRAVKRIEDVRMLRAAQFPEDAGPLAHPVRPDSYIEISNFYTATVYNKGAELIRMIHTILGPEKFRAGCDLYFSSHDGEAVTCEDFVLAMEQASGIDLGQFRLWYAQAGTPRVKARLSDDRKALLLEQEVPPTPGQPAKQPMPIPLRLAVLDEETGATTEERLFVFDQASAEVPFAGPPERPVVSLKRDLSAPIVLETDRGVDALAVL